MGELGLNKIFGALLAVALVIMGLREVSAMISGGGHHGYHSYESSNEWAKVNFKGYRIEIPETGGGGNVVEVIYDLGALLLAADTTRGERSFKAKCASCHTIEQGGTNGTGPNLYGALGGAKQSIAGFNYSGALSNTEGSWSWENMDAWLENPSSYARGTNMAFAGLKRNDERAAVLMYLASYSPDAPEQPAPLPAVSEEASVESDAVETAEAAEEVFEETVNAAVEAGPDTAATEDAATALGEAAVAVETAPEVVPAAEAETSITEAVTGEATDALTEAVDAGTAAVSETVDEVEAEIPEVTGEEPSDE